MDKARRADIESFSGTITREDILREYGTIGAVVSHSDRQDNTIIETFYVSPPDADMVAVSLSLFATGDAKQHSGYIHIGTFILEPLWWDKIRQALICQMANA